MSKSKPLSKTSCQVTFC